MRIPVRFLFLVALSPWLSTANAEISLPALFSDHLVLQRDKPVAVWGWADFGEEVTVEFGGQKKTGTPDKSGSWQVQLDPMLANATPAELTVSGKNTLTVKDVLVGEVWICSGQSNMQWTVRQSKDPEKEIAAADFPLIRHFAVPRTTSPAPQEDCEGQWAIASPETAGNFTAVGFYFGRELYRQLDVPIGLINSSWGGTRCEAWTSHAGLEAEPAAGAILSTWQKAIDTFDPEAAKALHSTQLEQWEKKVETAKANGKKAPRRPALRGDPALSRHAASTLYNAMIAPLAPYGIRGAIWYQGESNRGRAFQYRSIFPAMISDWRKLFGQGDFPFYLVQLANFQAATTAPNTPDSWAELQEAQTLTLRKIKNTGMATINDIGDAKNIHPKNKQEVGRRLALWALAGPYGKKDLVHSGPIYRESKIEGDRIRILFDHVGGGLKTRDGGALQRFEIAGQDRKFVWATAEIDGGSVVVHSPDIKGPEAVRYAWAANPEGANLINAEGLPASLFRTDDWPGMTVETTDPAIGF